MGFFWYKNSKACKDPSHLPDKEVGAASPALVPHKGGRNGSHRKLPWAKSKGQEIAFCCWYTALFSFEGKEFWSSSSTISCRPVESRSCFLCIFKNVGSLLFVLLKVLLNFTLSGLSTFFFGISFCVFRATIKTKEIPAWDNEVWCTRTQRWFDNIHELGRKAEDEVQHVITAGSGANSHCYLCQVTWYLGMLALSRLRQVLQKCIH